MKPKERYIARLEEVTITREGDYAVIEYKEEGIPSTHLQIGPEIAGMSDGEIVDLYNECLRAEAKRAAEYKARGCRSTPRLCANRVRCPM